MKKCLPDDGDELGHGELLRHQELGLVELRQRLLLVEALDDDGHFVRELAANALHLFDARG